VQILGGDAVHVGGGDFLDFRLVLVEPVGRVAVVFVGHALAENFVGRVEAEDERVEDGVFGVLDFFVGDGVLGEVVDIFIGGLNGFNVVPLLVPIEICRMPGWPKLRQCRR
jgi:hypothetical protein